MQSYLKMLQASVLSVIKHLKLGYVMMPPPKNMREAADQEIAGFELLYRGIDVLLSGGDSTVAIEGVDMIIGAMDKLLAVAPEKMDLTHIWEARARQMSLRQRLEMVNDVLAEHEQLEAELIGFSSIPKDQLN